MKSRILIITLLMLSAIMGFVISSSNTKTVTKNETPQSTSPQENPQNRWLERFYIGAVHDGIDCKDSYRNLDSLGFNMWHMYALGNDLDLNDGKHYPRMLWSTNCGLFTPIENDKTLIPVNDYKVAVNDRIADIRTSHPNMRIVTMRPKIEYLCYGQRSDYQCDTIPASDELWFYAFNKHETGIQETDNTQWGAGAKVRHCRTIPMNATHDNPGNVVKELRANTEQCKVVTGGNEWQGDANCEWLIKPRIRIDSSVAHSSQDPIVCNIKVISETGIELKNVDIKASYFLVDNDLYYNGRYIEEFNFPIGTNLTIPGNWGTSWQYKARGIDNNTTNQADIQVYWYGNCDMWIDYVRVDNDVADKLFKGYYDDDNHPERQWIKNEVQQIGMETKSNGEPMFMKYYIELVEFNNLPCMAYVNSKLKFYSDNQIDLVQDLTNIISVHVPWEDNANQRDRTSIENAGFLYRNYIQKVGFTQVFAESYPMSGCYTTNPDNTFSKIPNTLPIHDGHDTKILAKAVPPAEYDTWLQDNLNAKPYVLEQAYHGGDLQCGLLSQDKGNFRYKMQLCDSLSKLANIPFIFMPQVHQWYMLIKDCNI